MKYLKTIILVVILLLALFLRVFQLNKVPPALFGDEIDVGYQAYSLLTTGMDLKGNFLPTYIQSLAEYRAPLYIYSDVPFIALFGLNEWGVRLSAVFWGIISIVGIYFLASKLFNSKVGLFAAGLLAISPWHLQYSRAGFEVTMLLAFLIFGIYFFILGIKSNKLALFISAVLFSLSLYIYSTAVLFVPLCLVILFLVYRKEAFDLKRINLVIALIIGVVILAPFFISLVSGKASSRFSGISIFQDSVLSDKINLAQKSQSFYDPDGKTVTNNPREEKLFHNKPTVYAQVFFVNYLKALSPSFLFAEGDINFRQSIHEMGELYYFEIILLLIGVWVLVTKESLSKKILIGGLLLISPIPASLTADGGYHATRLILMLPFLVILNSLGAFFIWENIRKINFKVLAGLCLILFVFNFTFYLHRYYEHYPAESWRWWHVGFKEAMLYMKENDKNYSKIVFNNSYEPAMTRFLFWWQYPAEDFQKNYQETGEIKDVLPGFNGQVFKNRYYFGTVNKGSVNEFIKPGKMYMVSARDEVQGDWDWSKSPPAGVKVLKTVVNPLGQPIFFVITSDHQ